MEARQYYQALDEFELKRRAELANELSIPLGILTLMSGFNFAIVGSVNYKFSITEYAVLIPILISMIILCVSAIVLWRAHVGVGYMGPSSADKIQEYLTQLDEWANGFEGKSTQVDLAFADYIQKNQIENAAYNARVNELRAKRILFQKQLLGVALIFACMGASAHSAAQIFNSEYRQQVSETR